MRAIVSFFITQKRESGVNGLEGTSHRRVEFEALKDEGPGNKGNKE